MKIEIWSDVVCPWCYIGKRRFEEALSMFTHREEVEIIWRSFELDVDAPKSSGETTADLLSRKYNMSHHQALASIARTTATASVVGLEFRLDEAIQVNTFDAHRVTHMARDEQLGNEAYERLLRAHFTEVQDLGDHDTLVRLMAEIGIDKSVTQVVLGSDRYAREVRIEQETARDLGVKGVPFFVVDRSYGVSGAQSSDVFLDMLQDAWQESHA